MTIAPAREPTSSVLVLFAHPALHRSRANRALLDAASSVPGVEVHDLYETYPDLIIDMENEQRRIAAARALVFQHPFYWYSAPSLIKEWLDVVLTHGFAYGRGGTAIAGKPWLQAVTAGGPHEAYRAGGYNRFSTDDLLRPFEATAGLCGCRWQAPFLVHESRQLPDAALGAAAVAYAQRLAALAATPAGAL
jgi:glutathione-regulated potassium-efflux system ancillary protein KefG